MHPPNDPQLSNQSEPSPVQPDEIKASIPISQTLLTDLLKNGHVGAFAEAYQMQPYPPIMDSPNHMKNLCELLITRENAWMNVIATQTVHSPTRLEEMYQSIKELADFCLEFISKSAIEYCQQALDLANTLQILAGDKYKKDNQITESSNGCDLRVSESHALLGTAYTEMGMHEHAIPHFRKSTNIPEIRDRLVKAVLHLGHEEEHAQNYIKAISLYKETLQCINATSDRNEQNLEMQLICQTGIACLQIQDYENAERCLYQFHTWAQDHGTSGWIPSDGLKHQVILGMAQCSESKGDLEGAVEILSKNSGSSNHHLNLFHANLLNRLNRGGDEANILLAHVDGDVAACQLGISIGSTLVDCFLVVHTAQLDKVNQGPKEMLQYFFEIRNKYGSAQMS